MVSWQQHGLKLVQHYRIHQTKSTVHNTCSELSQFQQFFLIFLKCLGLYWRKIYNWVKVRIWVLNQIIVVTVFLFLQPQLIVVYIQYI